MKGKKYAPEKESASLVPLLDLPMYSLPAATKLGQGNVFTGACHSVHGGGAASVHAGIPPPPPPREQTPPRADPPPGADTPPEQTPPREADASIRSMSGRYASYWNAFSFLIQSLLECWVGGEIATGSEFIHMYLLRKSMPKYSITGQTDQWRFCRDNFRMRPHQNFFNFIFWKMFNKMFYPSAKQTASLTFIPSSQLIHKSPLVRKHATACRAR